LNDLEAEVFKELCPPNIAFLRRNTAWISCSNHAHSDPFSFGCSFPYLVWFSWQICWLHAQMAVHSGHLRWRFKNPMLVDDPVLANGTLYVASADALHALNAQTDAQLREVPLSGLSTALALAYGLLYFGTRTDTTTTMQFQALDLKSGQVVWSQTVQGAQSACNPFVADHVVYLCTQNEATTFGEASYYWIDALDASSGKPLRELVSGSSSYVPGALLVADGHIYNRRQCAS
jgi:outer membrane protein assembly factor BamB